MSEYTFEVDVMATGTVTVQADSYDEAEAKAKKAKYEVGELYVQSVDNVVCLLDGPDDE